MPLPSLLLSFLLASIYGLTFYFVFGRGWIALGVYWIVALSGFALGQFLSSALSFSLLPVGSVNAIEASITSIILLFLTRTLWKR
jgi:hypothetical protein